MSQPREASPADLCERHQRRAVFALLGVALIQAVSVVEGVAGATDDGPYDLVRKVLAIAVIALMLSTLLWKARNRPGSRHFFRLQEQGFVADALRRAYKASWFATFLILFLGSKSSERFDSLPPHVFLDAVLVVMLVVFSSVFLFLSRGGGADDFADGEDA